MSVLQLVQRPQGQIVDGAIRFNDEDIAYDIAKMPVDEMQKIRGNKISMIFQEPMTSLNPVFRIGAQINEVIELHNPELDQEKVTAKQLSFGLGYTNSGGVYKCISRVSGGMSKELAPWRWHAIQLIIADEPTTALDVTIQAQILDLLKNLKDKINSSTMLITHDLGVIAEMADYVVVMYAGKVVEQGLASEVFSNPSHPYTIGLMNSKPSINKKVNRLYSIPGKVPNPINMPNYCFFRDRCDRAFEKCAGPYPDTYSLTDSHSVACYHYEKEERDDNK